MSGDRTQPLSRQERQALADQLLDELTGDSARERVGMFKRWHQGGLSLVHLNVLAVLESRGACSMTELAQALDVSVASATGIVDRVERRGLVVREHAVGDRRLVLVHVTEAGTSVFSDLRARRREHLEQLLEQLSDEELAGFLAGLRAMNAARGRLMAAGCQDEDDASTPPSAEPGGTAEASRDTHGAAAAGTHPVTAPAGAGPSRR